MTKANSSETSAWHLMYAGNRRVWAPNDLMREEHEVINHYFDKTGIEFDYATGGLRGNNIAENALRHSGSRYFFQIDLARAYGQVDMPVLADRLFRLQFAINEPLDHETILKILNESCLSPDGAGLVMGGPSSPRLFNAYCLDMDLAIADYCRRVGIIYTRYMDDLVFSSPDTGELATDSIGKRKRRDIREIIAQYMFEINESKTRVQDIKHGPINVTGIQINPGGRIQLRNQLLRNFRNELRRKISHLDGSAGDPYQYASGINGLLNVTIDPDSKPSSGRTVLRRLSRDERILLELVQEVMANKAAYSYNVIEPDDELTLDRVSYEEYFWNDRIIFNRWLGRTAIHPNQLSFDDDIPF